MKVDFINAEWVKKYCEIEIESQTESWNKHQRPKNDGHINANHSGYVHALERLKRLIETLESLEERKQDAKR